MNSEERIALIKQRLTQAFNPSYLEIVDEGHKHIGHPGAKSGGHFAIIIACEKFQHENLLACHRMIYTVLDDLMEKEIHALKIKIRPYLHTIDE